MLQKDQQKLIINKKDAIIYAYGKKSEGWRKSSSFLNLGITRSAVSFKLRPRLQAAKHLRVAA
jgi:hypothetical protein